MRVRSISTIGIGVATLGLVATAALPAVAGTAPRPTTAAAAAGFTATGTGAVAGSGAYSPAVAAKTKCGTSFGTEVANGIVSWNSGGNEASGAADFTCPKKAKKRTFKKITVKGMYGDADQSTFDVT